MGSFLDISAVRRSSPPATYTKLRTAHHVLSTYFPRTFQGFLCDVPAEELPLFANTTGGLVLSRMPVDPSLVERYGWRTSTDVAAATRLQVCMPTMPTLTMPLTLPPTLALTLARTLPLPLTLTLPLTLPLTLSLTLTLHQAGVVDPAVAAFVEQLLCADADDIVLNMFSTFSRHIARLDPSPKPQPPAHSPQT